MDNERTLMYPEAFPRKDLPPTEDGWKVEDGYADMVDLDKRRLVVPASTYQCPCGHDHAEAVRLHEYGHLAYTPADHKDRAKARRLPQNLVLAVEDARIGIRASQEWMEAPPRECPNAIDMRLSRILAMGDVRGVTIELAKAWGNSKTRPEALKWAQSIENAELRVPLLHAINGLNSLTYVSGADFRYTLDVAEHIISSEKALKNALTTGKASGDAEGAHKKKDIGLPWEDPDPWHKGKVPDRTEFESRWARMKIINAPLTRPARNKPTRRWTVRDEGTIPSSIHRYSVDGRIFKQPVHRDKGYVLLIDTSGSMRWDPEDLHAVLNHAPATTVALYSSTGGNNGSLKIVSHNGRRCEDSEVYNNGSGNGVDGPALAWLISQKGRHIWLSDAGVTGRGDNSGTNLYVDVARLMIAGDVMRTTDAEQTIGVVKGNRPFIPTDPFKDPVIEGYIPQRASFATR